MRLLRLLFPPPPPVASRQLDVEGLSVHLLRKPIRTLNLRLKSPGGAIHVSAPLRLSEARIRAFVLERRAWIERHQAQMAARPPKAELAYADGDAIHVLGQTLTLRLLPGRSARARIEGTELQLKAPAAATRAQREAAVQRCLARHLLAAAQALLPAKVAALGVPMPALRIRRMRSRWGTCAIRSQVVTLALELVHKEPKFLGYILVHELAHLRVRTHGKLFKSLMDKHVEGWRGLRKQLR